MRLRILTVLAALFLVGSPILAAPARPAASQDDALEMLVRHQANLLQSIKFGGVKLVFLSIGMDGKDPSPALLKRFAGWKLRVEGASKSKLIPGGGVEHATTGEKGVLIYVNEIHKSGANMVVEGGTYEDKNMAARFGYDFLLSKGRLLMDKVRMIAEAAEPEQHEARTLTAP